MTWGTTQKCAGDQTAGGGNIPTAGGGIVHILADTEFTLSSQTPPSLLHKPSLSSAGEERAQGEYFSFEVFVKRNQLSLELILASWAHSKHNPHQGQSVLIRETSSEVDITQSGFVRLIPNTSQMHLDTFLYFYYYCIALIIALIT